METHVTGLPVLGELRQQVLLPLIGHPLFSEAEQLRANHSVHESDDIVRLTRWGANVLAEIARREAEAARPCHSRATLRSASFRGSRPRRPAPRWVPGAFFPDGADRRATAQFQPADALTFASLLSRQSR